MDFLNKIDKQQVQKITLIVIAALTILALVLLLVIIIASVNPATPFGLADGFSDLKEITITEQDLKTGTLVLADEDHNYKVSAEWLDLVEGCQAYRNEQLDEEGIDYTDKTNLPYIPWKGMRLSLPAMAAAHKMLSDAKEEVDQKAIVIDGTYGMVYHGGAENPEFNTGLLMYLSDYESEADEHVELSKEYRKWLKENAAEYGFIESFEDGYRYVGIAHAKAISGNSKDDIENLEDYIEYLKENTSVDKTAEIKVDGNTYKSYYVSCKKGDTIKVPKDADYTISGTNEGGVIVTVKVK
jgi:phage anti-repressor protein